jgi:hypothetical protein
MTTGTEIQYWRRLTKNDVVNWLIMSLILDGLDTENELVADGDLGPYLEKIIATHALTMEAEQNNPAASTRQSFVEPFFRPPFAQTEIARYLALQKLARKIGYFGEAAGMVDYIHSLPDNGPIG